MTSNHAKRMIPLTILLLGLIFIVGLGTVSADSNIIYVNNDTGNDTWDGQSSAYNSTSGSGPKLSIKNATGTVSNNGTVNIANGLYTGENNTNININQNITIIGESQDGTIINAEGNAQIFIIQSGANVTIANLTMTNGKNTATYGGAISNSGNLAIVDCAVTGNSATKSNTGGGAIYNSGNMIISDSTISFNTAKNLGGAIYNTGNMIITGSIINNNTATASNGGAIYNFGSAANLTIVNSTFNGNKAGNGGGAIDNYNYNSLTVIGSTFTGNSCWARHGGAIDNWKSGSVGPVTIINCIFIGNSAYQSGGAFNVDDGCTASVFNCTFLNNTAERAGAVSIWDNSALNITNCYFSGNTVTSPNRGYGGAINNHNYSTTNITNCTFENNDAVINGGAVSNFKSTMTITGCAFLNNHAAASGGAIDNDVSSTLTVTNSTFFNNTANIGGVLNNYGSSTLNMTGCTLLNNTAISSSGAIDNQAALILNYSRIVGNSAPSGTGSAINNNGGTVNALYNWWGFNIPEFASLISGIADHSSWLYMTINATPTIINNTETSLITVSFNNLFNGTAVTALDTSLGYIPDGSPVNFKTDRGTVGSKSIDKTTLGGIATAILTANELAGVAHVNATTDNETQGVNVTIAPKSSLYLAVTPSNTSPTVGDNVIYTLKVGNNGPDAAENVVMTYTIPAGLEFVGASDDMGNTWTYDPVTRTITWNMSTVPVGDPTLRLTLKVNQAGSFIINPRLTTTTYDPTLNSQTQSLSIKAANKPAAVNAATTTSANTVGMQTTGAPIVPLALGILSVLGGLTATRRRK